jgi:predicted nucleotidyltransferase
MVTFGPEVVIGAEFAGISGIRAAYIFGSLAARYEGAAGPRPNDVDVLVVGEVNRDDVYDAAERAETRVAGRIDRT